MSFEVQHLAAGEPTPWFGLLERITIGVYLLWVAVLALLLFEGELAPGRALTPASAMS
jgi:hypothetical protein